MKIGIFGHSKALFKSNKSYCHYSERVNEALSDHQVNWYGVQCCSVDRLVYNISNHSNFDLYMIFHTRADNLYCPGWEIDVPASVLFKALKTEKGLQVLYKHHQRDNIPNIDLDAIRYFKNVYYDDKRELNYLSKLFLMKSLLINKNVIHVSCYGGVEKQIFKNDYFANELQTVISGTQFNYDIVNWDHELISRLFIKEIQTALNL